MGGCDLQPRPDLSHHEQTRASIPLAAFFVLAVLGWSPAVFAQPSLEERIEEQQEKGSRKVRVALWRKINAQLDAKPTDSEVLEYLAEAEARLAGSTPARDEARVRWDEAEEYYRYHPTDDPGRVTFETAHRRFRALRAIVADDQYSIYRYARHRYENEELPLSTRVHSLKRAHDAVGQANNSSGLAWTTTELTLRYRETRQFEEAERVTREGHRRVPRFRGRYVEITIDLAELLQRRGEYDASVDLFEDGLEIVESRQRRLGPRQIHELRSRCWAGLGGIYLDLGIVDQAARCIREQRKAVDALSPVQEDEKGLLNAVLLNEIKLHLTSIQHERVDQEIEKLLTDIDQFQGADWAEERQTLRLHQVLALMNLEQREPDRPPRAETILRELVEESLAGSLLRFESHLRLAQILLRNNRPHEAAAQLAAADTQLEHVDPGSINLAFLAALHSWADRSQGASEETLRLRLDGLEATFDALIAHWKLTKARKGGVGLLRSDRVQFVLSELVAMTLRRHGETSGAVRALDHILRAKSCSSLPQLMNAPSLPASELPRLVQPGEGILSYVRGPERSHLFAIDSDGIEHFELAGRIPIRLKRVELVALVTAPPHRRPASSPPLDKLTREMGQLLLPPRVQERLAGWQFVTIAGRSLVGDLPFEALRLENGDELGLVKALGYSPSLAVDRALLARRQARAGQTYDLAVVVVAAPGYTEAARQRFGIAPLDFGWRDRRALRVGFDANRTRLLTGPEATLTAVDQWGPRAPLLHILTHGVHNYLLEVSSGLLLAPEGFGDDGSVWADDFEAMSFPPAVILSACSVGRGPQRRGEEISSTLAGPILRNGADVVLFPTVDVHYRSTVQLTSRFQHHLGAGQPPSEALRRARVELSEDSRFNDPYFYSGMQLGGLAHWPVYTAPEPSVGKAITGWLAALLVGLSFLQLFRELLRRGRRNH